MGNQVIFLAYANSTERPLPTLNKESSDVYSILMKDYLKGHYILHRDQFATPQSINDNLKDLKNNLAIFTYSGHAGSDTILLNDTQVHSDGIAFQLKQSAQSGVLKIVILNGCSTAGQVKTLLKLGVPVVIATNAQVSDYSASEFAIRFFQNLSEEGINIKQAYFSALTQAQNMTNKSLGIEGQKERGVDTLEDVNDILPLWGLFYNDKNALEINPLPIGSANSNSSFIVNKCIRKALFETLYRAGNSEICDIKKKEQNNELVEEADKDIKIINVLPMPIGEQLRKLLCPSNVQYEEEGYDKINLRRINQICKVFHTTVELMGCIMVSQLWEEKLKPDDKRPPELMVLPAELIDVLKQHFYLTSSERETFDYLPFIRTIRKFFDTLNNGNGIKYFIEELSQLKEIIKEDGTFNAAYNYLTNLSIRAANQKIKEAEVLDICEKAEEKLADFIYHLGFLHRYSLTSIQNISILKYRHSPKAKFNHSVIKLMRIGGSEKFIYQWIKYMDNQGVVLLKGNIRLVDREKKQFEADDNLEFLNLSPFIIETSAFETNANKVKLGLFTQYIPSSNIYWFKNFIDSSNKKDWIEIGVDSKYRSIKEELDDYRNTILNEHL